ncbi:MAG: tetratricopeptide repeat protein [Kiritimatiellae bacterium]|nr:tetratricopeptide repeat protein [Kiritimatiellia bacterium]
MTKTWTGLWAAAALAWAGCGPAPVGKVYERAVSQLKAGETGEGIAGLEEVLEREPDGAFAGEAWNWLGLAKRASGDLDGAAKAFGRAMGASPGDYRPAFNLARLELERGNADAALPLLKQADQLNPAGPEVPLLLGDLLTRKGQWARAKSAYYQAEKRDPQSAAAATGLGRAFWLEGDAARAETEFMRALEIEKDYGPALYNLGVLNAASDGGAERAGEYFRRYLEAEPAGERADAARRRMGGEALEQTSFAAGAPQKEGSGGAETAAGAWKKAVEERSETAAAHALELARESRDPQGAEIAKRAASGFPNSADVQLAAGGVWEENGDMASAMGAYKRAQALDPENADALWALARAAGKAGEDDVAAMALMRLVKLEPGNADALWGLAETFGEKLGMTGKGATAYKAFEKRFPADPRAAEVRARVAALEAAAAAEAAAE